jgi:hypothetical protein
MFQIKAANVMYQFSVRLLSFQTDKVEYKFRVDRRGGWVIYWIDTDRLTSRWKKFDRQLLVYTAIWNV